MSITSTSRRNNYSGDDSTLVWAYTFKLFSRFDVEVKVRNKTTGVETTLVLTTDYTVEFVGIDQGGTITLVDASQAWIASGGLSSNYEISIRLHPVLAQDTDIKNNTKYLASLHERRFDKDFQTFLDFQDQLDRSIKLPSSIDPSDFSTDLPSDVIASGAGKYFAVNSDASGIELVDGTATDLSGIQSDVDNLAIDVDTLQTDVAALEAEVAALDLSSYVTISHLNDGSLNVFPLGMVVPVNTTFYTTSSNANGKHFTILKSGNPTVDSNIIVPDRASLAIMGPVIGQSFTPVLALTSGSVTYGASTYAYARVKGVESDVDIGTGRCQLHIRIELSAISTPVNTAMKITGIPFKRWSSYPVFTTAPVMVHNGTVTGQVYAKVSHDGSTDEFEIELFAVNNGVTTALSAAAFLQSNTTLYFSMEFDVQAVA